MPIFAQECQDAATLAYRTFDGKIAHVIRCDTALCVHRNTGIKLQNV